MRALPAAPVRRRSLSDAGSVCLAVAVVLGAEVSRPLPLVVGPVVALLAFGVRRPWLLVLAGALTASTLGARADAGLRPMRPAQIQGVVSLVTDPSSGFGGERAIVRWKGRRLEVRAPGSAAGAISTSLAGEQVVLTGRVRPPPPDDTWLRVHHVVGLVQATSAERIGAGSAPWRAANRVRRLLERGAESMPRTARSLFTGFVLGDSRDEPATVADDFRASGLTHLLAVSGENVAFVLALLGPVLRRLRLGGRWMVTVGAIGFFVLITRGEPSVLRAAVMAGLSVTAGSLGRHLSPIRLLAFAVAGLVLVDPFLIGSVGFRLSVGASLGIVLAAPSLRRSLPGPAPFAEALAVSLAAQAGVAPVLLASFGGLPVVSVPANLLAVPAAGLVMVWGLGAGLLAGVTGGPVAVALHGPTRLLIAWISAVAERAAGLPLGDLHAPGASVLILGLALVVVGIRSARPRWIGPGYGLVVLALVTPALLLRWSSPPRRAEPTSGVVLWRSGRSAVLEVGGTVPAGRLLSTVRQAGVRRLDLVVLRAGGAMAAAQAAALRHRWPVGRLVEPMGGTVPDAEVAEVGRVEVLGSLAVTVVAVRPRLQVRVEARPARSGAAGRPVGSLRAPRARSPPPRHHLPSGHRGHLEPDAGFVL